ncbi:asparagine synthase (glutamine-hydrolyzing) [Carboxylicivirga linearis]|uniref:asparagine synthase (glutamine-hydrolyzing) n=1 Tax=Carboxylicivirga linearis TaxID=1628157 RepID=A0ABS5JWB6_9BACT|nr:asparagine synthase (glutamine-hydrolyzing) [Carboxylicivirga linearis]MBS2099080.1 asparagine synthase (glutamine-hydrolyzing) [Carboxylicivirga linearis]
MCRIIGEYRLAENLTEQSRFEELTQLSKNGGPDDTDFYRNERVQLGFNRLAILDLSVAGRQPMCSNSGRYIIVFNGEVYNHLDLRAKTPDYQFRGSSDTETILSALEKWGLRKTVELLDGMFGLAIYDTLEDCLYLVRDFAGIKPIFYGYNRKGLVFASQYDQVSKHPWFINEEIDQEVLSLYLKMQYVPAPLGLKKNTGQVLPGECISINSKGELNKWRYWELPDKVDNSIQHWNEAVEFVNEQLESTVRSQLMADVPLGAFLSGGIDSALVCYNASKNLNDQLSTYTIGSDSARHDETEDAKTVAQMLNTKGHYDRMNASSASNLMEEVFGVLSEPFADFSIIPTYLVSKHARSGLTVALSGDGGDELFYGYERFESISKNRSLANWPYLMRYMAYGGDKLLLGGKYLNSGVVVNKQAIAHMNLHARFEDEQLYGTFPEFKDTHFKNGFGVYTYSNSTKLDDLLNNMRKAEFYGMMQKTLLKVDRASMGVGLEVRVPFLSKVFIEASLKVNSVLSYGNGKRKHILKTVLKKNMPKYNFNTSKRGFTVPLGQWMREDLKDYMYDHLLSKSYLDSFGLNSAGIEHLLSQHINKGLDKKWPLFTLLSLFKWQEKQNG